MADETKKIAESIRSGSYFVQAKDWFQAVYIGPISERSFFLIIAVLSLLIGIFSVMSVMRLLPITKREAMLVPAVERYDERQMTLVRLAQPHEETNLAVSRFFLTEYVTRRESYTPSQFAQNARFVRGQSDEETYNAYGRAYNPTNPESPFAALSEDGQRQVKVQSVHQKRGDAGKMHATVQFSVTTTIHQQDEKTEWTADIDYIYTQLTPELVDNPETGQEELRVNDPQFQVVNYVLAPRS